MFISIQNGLKCQDSSGFVMVESVVLPVLSNNEILEEINEKRAKTTTNCGEKKINRHIREFGIERRQNLYFNMEIVIDGRLGHIKTRTHLQKQYAKRLTNQISTESAIK